MPANRTESAADAHDRHCLLCEHRCGVDRSASERGRCRAGTTAHVFRHRVEYGEEPELVPSHLFYTSGCDLRCGFCIAGIDAFDPSRGTPLTGAFLRDAVAWGRARGAKTLQWVGGEPTIHLPAILRAMGECDRLPPVVWKSDFFGTPQALDLLRGHVDTYVADFKFGNDACARRLAGVDDYVRIVTRNLLAVAGHGRRLIVRHLLLPGHADCCYGPIVRWMADHLPGVPLSLRDSYLPSWRSSSYVELAAPLPRSAGAAGRALARAVGLTVIQ